MRRIIQRACVRAAVVAVFLVSWLSPFLGLLVRILRFAVRNHGHERGEHDCCDVEKFAHIHDTGVGKGSGVGAPGGLLLGNRTATPMRVLFRFLIGAASGGMPPSNDYDTGAGLRNE